jgi:ribonuclease HII
MPNREFMRKKFDLSLLPPSPNLAFEKKIWKNGYQAIVGIDEAGRGALAGPVYAGTVILPNNSKISDQLLGVNDSKKMTQNAREKWYQIIKDRVTEGAIGHASAIEIDEIGIVPATHLAARRALANLTTKYDFLLVDAFKLSEVDTPQRALIKGDARSLSIACASILAKVSRDKHLVEMAVDYPAYGFEKHKGYGTAYHREAIKKYGGCEEHRKTFAPLKYEYEN